MGAQRPFAGSALNGGYPPTTDNLSSYRPHFAERRHSAVGEVVWNDILGREADGC